MSHIKNTTINQIYKKYKKKFKFLKIDFGQILIFSPILLHGNIVNKTPSTRIALNCRFKSLLSPFDVFQKTHRNIPHFFRPLNIKPLTKIGFNFINTIEKKREKKNEKNLCWIYLFKACKWSYFSFIHSKSNK